MRKKAMLLAILAVILVLGASVAPAWGYFTDWTEANGGLEVKLTPEPTVHEWYAKSTKHVTVGNAADATTPVFARARVLSSLPVEVAGEGWAGPVADSSGIEWYYFGASETDLTEIAPGASSGDLEVTITFPRLKSETQPDGTAAYGDQYNVIVYYEATAVEYREDGTPFADWTKAQGGQNSQGGN